MYLVGCRFEQCFLVQTQLDALLATLFQKEGITNELLLECFLCAWDSAADLTITKALLKANMPINVPFRYLSTFEDVYVCPVHLAAQSEGIELLHIIAPTREITQIKDNNGDDALVYAKKVDND